MTAHFKSQYKNGENPEIDVTLRQEMEYHARGKVSVVACAHKAKKTENIQRRLYNTYIKEQHQVYLFIQLCLG